MFEKLFMDYYLRKFAYASVKQKLYSRKFEEKKGFRCSQYALQMYLDPLMGGTNKVNNQIF